MVRNLIKICNQTNDDLPLVTALERSLSREASSTAAKLNQKALLTSRIAFTTPLDFQPSTFKTPDVPVMEVKPSGFNFQPPKNAKDLVKDTQGPLIDPRVIAQAKANKERELEYQNKPEGELTRQLPESPSYIGLCKLLRAQIVGTHIEDLKTPMMRPMLSGSEITYRQDATQARPENQESTPAAFNPLEGLMPMRGLSSFSAAFGRSPTAQFGRYQAQPEDESLFDERATPLSAIMAKYRLQNAQYNEQDARHNY